MVTLGKKKLQFAIIQHQRPNYQWACIDPTRGYTKECVFGSQIG
jgi:hypothetical protein